MLSADQIKASRLAALLLPALLTVPALAHDPPRTKVTWTGDIARLVAARCVRCHSPEGKGPMSLATYDAARPWAKAIREEVLARRMPKWHAARGYGQFRNDPTLSPFEISLFMAWVDGGALRGADRVKLDGVAIPEPPPDSGRTRNLTRRCDNQRLPAGTLVALTPELPEEASAGFVAALPDGRQEILAWIRGYEPEFKETYWLQSPLALPAGSRLIVDTTGPCSVTLHFQR